MGFLTSFTIFKTGLQKALDKVSALLANQNDATLSGLRLLDEVKAERPDRLDITIPATGWVNDGQGKYPYHVDVAVSGITAQYVADVTIQEDSEDTAAACGLDRRNNTVDGAIRFRAASVPSAAMSAKAEITDESESEE